MKNLRALARSLRSVKLGDRAKSCPLPLPIRLARLSRTKPRGCAGVRSLRRLMCSKKGPKSHGNQCVKGRFRECKTAWPASWNERGSPMPGRAEGGAKLWSPSDFWHGRGPASLHCRWRRWGREKGRPRCVHRRAAAFPPELRFVVRERASRMRPQSAAASRGERERCLFESRGTRLRSAKCFAGPCLPPPRLDPRKGNAGRLRTTQAFMWGREPSGRRSHRVPPMLSPAGISGSFDVKPG
jgi:hypothetical protein